MPRSGAAVLAALLLTAEVARATPRQPSLFETDAGKASAAIIGAATALNVAVGVYNLYTASEGRMPRGTQVTGMVLGVLQLLFSSVVLGEGYLARVGSFRAPPEDLVVPLLGALIGAGCVLGNVFLPVAKESDDSPSIALAPWGLGLSVAIRWR